VLIRGVEPFDNGYGCKTVMIIQEVVCVWVCVCVCVLITSGLVSLNLRISNSKDNTVSLQLSCSNISSLDKHLRPKRSDESKCNDREVVCLSVSPSTTTSVTSFGKQIFEAIQRTIIGSSIIRTYFAMLPRAQVVCSRDLGRSMPQSHPHQTTTSMPSRLHCKQEFAANTSNQDDVQRY
jgi:hypothetical protein